MSLYNIRTTKQDWTKREDLSKVLKVRQFIVVYAHLLYRAVDMMFTYRLYKRFIDPYTNEKYAI